MRFQALRTSLVTGYMTLSCILWSLPGQGGGITSANAPEMPQPPTIPGTIRFSCELSVDETREFYTSASGIKRDRVGLTTTLEFEKADGDWFFKCSEGCEKTWPTAASGKLRPSLQFAPKPEGLHQVSWPSLRFDWLGGNPVLRIEVQAGHLSDSGAMIKAKQLIVETTSRRELYAEAKSQEIFFDISRLYDPEEKARIDEHDAKAQKPIKLQAEGTTMLRCLRLRPDDMTRTEIARLLTQPPRAGRISSEQYTTEKAQKLNWPVKRLLALTRQLDPGHRRAMIGDLALTFGGLDFLKAIIPQVKKIIAESPDMTVENLWALTAHMLKIPAMSPTGIVAGNKIALLLVEDEPAK